MLGELRRMLLTAPQKALVRADADTTQNTGLSSNNEFGRLGNSLVHGIDKPHTRADPVGCYGKHGTGQSQVH